MDDLHLSRSFARIGARVGSGVHDETSRVRVDVKRDRHGEYFEILAGRGVRVVVPDVQPDLRHLLLMAQVPDRAEKWKFLCGHDERHWFAAAVPGLRGVSGVRSAIEALKPDEVAREIEFRGVPGSEFASRRTSAYLRQGEWFFIPAPGMSVPELLTLRNEPMRRGGGKPHIVDFAYRTGGTTVYVDARGRTLTEMQFKSMNRNAAKRDSTRWRVARQNPDMYVKGRVRHPDHATIVLDCWHLVRMNTEHMAPSRRHLAFID